MKTPEELEKIAEEYERSITPAIEDADNIFKHERIRSFQYGYRAGYQAAAPQWINVKDRLPELKEQVLVYGRASMQRIRLVQPAVLKKNYSYAHNPLASEFEWEGFDIIGHDGEVDDVVEVTHWMPLPNPPTEDSK